MYSYHEGFVTLHDTSTMTVHMPPNEFCFCEGMHARAPMYDCSNLFVLKAMQYYDYTSYMYFPIHMLYWAFLYEQMLVHVLVLEIP